ncbi:hypothetical protein Hanom_Chr14g01332431 [Helianthus anomalus]
MYLEKYSKERIVYNHRNFYNCKANNFEVSSTFSRLLPLIIAVGTYFATFLTAARITLDIKA